MKNRFFSLFLFACLVAGLTAQNPETFTVDDIMSYPFTSDLTASRTGNRIVWAMNEKGERNLYAAEGPGFTPRKLTAFSGDEGQEFSSVSLSDDGKWVAYIRGGDFGSNWDDALPVNPNFLPEPPKVHIWSVPFEGGTPKSHGEGDSPVISPRGNQLAFVRGGQIWAGPVDGSAEPKKLFSARGRNGSPVWSPDGSRLAFVSVRDGHSFVGIYTNPETPVLWVAPSFHRDDTPVWSRDGARIAFIRRPGTGGAPQPILQNRHQPWQIMTADTKGGEAEVIWKAPETAAGSPPSTHGGYNLNWGDGALTFLSYHDGWPHLYAIPDGRQEARLLTKGNFMAEYISMSPDGRWLTFAGNTGPDPLDIDRRHVVRVGIDGAVQEVLTPGDGQEWTPYILGDGRQMAYISATSRRPPLPAIMDLEKKSVRLLARDKIPAQFPEKKLVTPVQAVFKAPDGTSVHATLFNSDSGPEKKPAIIYIHGGPPRQMLLGWHYSSYYANAYALNQYLASRGFVVISVNYRLGIGYGYNFHRPADGGVRGAGEYQDIKAAGEWLARQPFVDPARIGVYGGSYGGYLTAMALARNSDLFKAGVDIHGVHDLINGRVQNMKPPNQYEQAPDVDQAIETAWKSSPIADVGAWTSPVLIIHGDDDRNVAFTQSVDLIQRLEAKGVDLETLVIVDDTHHFMTFRNQRRVNEAAAGYLVRKLGAR